MTVTFEPHRIATLDETTDTTVAPAATVAPRVSASTSTDCPGGSRSATEAS